MGYTHYWTFKPIPKGKAKQVEAKYQRAIKECSTVVRSYSKANGGLSGFTAHCKPGLYGGLQVNGSKDEGHEEFSLREHYNQNFEKCNPRMLECSENSFHFCKTARKPYDKVVVACLLILKRHLGDLIEVSSDGDCCDWWSGQIIADLTLNKKHQIPNTIRKSQRCTCSELGQLLHK
jgi:hypothetical protein